MPPLNDRLDQMRTLAKENWHFICPFQIRAEKPYYVADPEVDSLVSYLLPLHLFSSIQGVPDKICVLLRVENTALKICNMQCAAYPVPFTVHTNYVRTLHNSV